MTLVAMAVYVAGERLKSLHQQITFARTLGSYTLVKKLGEGGMGSVYLAKHALLRRPTAVKVIRAEKATEELRSRFEREVQCTSRLTHPNTISVFDYGHSSDGRFYYAMEYIDGLSLEAVVRSFGAFPSDRAIHVLEQVCGAVAEAHSHDIVHRDLKPENIMLCCRGGVPDFVKVLDFGLAKTFESVGSDLSQTGGLIGTPGYMAPEAVTSGSANARTDVFSLGAVLYFLIAGKPAFHAPTAMGMLTLAMSGPPPPPSERLGRSVDPQLESLLMSCLAADPQVRPPDAASLLEHLQRLNRGTWTTARAHAWWQENGAEAQSRAEHDAPATGSGATLAVDMSGSSRQQAS